MLTIRPEQMQGIARGLLLGHLWARYPGACARRDAQWLKDLCRAAAAKARLYGIQYREGVFCLAEWMLIIHPNFEYLDQGAWARLILINEELTGAEKIGLIRDQLPDRELFRVGRPGE